ncbi:amidase family protein [Lasallia pustulata]|uniref:Amidase family protein n=1 Tax=Lasallia pustulata TaxID=136370 RepID=A0A1W5D598_9LECA|nr:amidase family protein [Lasallia pustulata]
MVASNWRAAAASLASLTLPIIATYNPGIGELASRNEYNSANFSDLAASEVLNEPFPYYFPDQNDAANLFPMPQCNGITLEEATIDQLQQYMSQRKLTSVQLVTCYMQREYQTREYINSILQLNPDVLTIAATLDSERAHNRVRGPLHGIPFLIKDNIASKDKLETTAGSFALLGSIVPRDAFVVSQLRQAGAVLLGKATLSEWADMRSNNYSEGYSARGGQARSSYNFTVNPGGSSTGSAIAVANNVVTFALGSETDGSVINPAERNAIVGIKPTVGLTSRAGVIPESTHQDTIGCFGRTVRDAVYALDAIYGVDPRDNYTSAQIGETPVGGYVPYISDQSALKGARFGLPWASFWALADPEQQTILLSLVSLISSAGATIVNNTELPTYQTIVSPTGWDWDYGSTRGYPNESEYTYIKVDFYNNIATYLSELTNTRIRSLADIVAFNLANAGSEGGLPALNPAFGSGQDGFLASLATGGIMNETYYQALSFCQASTRQHGIDAALANNGTPVDALLVPPDVAQSYQVAAQAGYPVVTVPAGVHSASGMPFGIAVMGTGFSEAGLVRWASAIEDLTLGDEGRWLGLGRSMPRWEGYLERNLPTEAQCFGC